MSEQLVMDLELDMPALTQLLKEWKALEEAEDALREQKRMLQEQYTERLPMRAVLTAMKIVRRRDKLAMHPKEPMPVHWQDYLEQTIAAIWGRQG